MRVISWCLYYQKLIRLPEYLMGLKCNQRAARVWFPGWHLRLYYHKNLRDHPALWEYVETLAKFGDPAIELIECRDTYHPMFERYRPFFEDQVEACIARDLDSILSKTDADLVHAWLAGSDPVLIYREHLMAYTSMGGGIGMRRNVATVTELTEKAFNAFKLGDDEDFLDSFLEGNKPNQITRMTDNGTYYLWPSETLLWIIPFPGARNGFLNTLPGVWYDTVDEVVALAKSRPIERYHIYAHLPQHARKIEWFR